MKSLRFLLSIAVAVYLTGAGHFVMAQETNTSPFSITLAPLQYADVKGNVGKFEVLNWMTNGANAGVSDITFIKNINKDISLDVEASAFPKTDDGTGHLILKDGDLAFLKIDYNAFRKYYDNTGGVYKDTSSIIIPGALSGFKGNSPNLQLDIGFFKLEAGLGAISDPFLDVTYEHNSKDGDKSLLMWTPVFNSGNLAYRLIGPSYEAVNDTSDTVTLKEKKDVAGITIKGEQKAEVDYNHNYAYMPFLNSTPGTASTYNQLRTENEYLDAKLFGSGVRIEKWMFNDKTFASLGYHYNHVHDTDLMQNQVLSSVTGLVTDYGTGNGASTKQSLWSFANALENEHVWVGNFNSILMPDLTLATDVKYEHIGSEGSSVYNDDHTNISTFLPGPVSSTMDNRQDNEGEHISLRYSGISHTSLYAESSLEQKRYWFDESMPGTFEIARLVRTEKESWTFGGKIVPDRFFTFTTQVKQRWEDNRYDTLLDINPGNQAFLDQLNINAVEESSTLTWKPYRWVQNSVKYQFVDAVYMPRETTENTSVGVYPISENHMLSSILTYDITVEPVDPLMLTLSYSHAENYIRTLQASQTGTSNIPTFNSGDNSWLFSDSYTPMENIVLTNTVAYTLSPNYVDISDGVPYGSSFKELTFTTGLEWTYHKWLKLGPSYEHASYRDNSLAGAGNYSANIFKLTAKFNW
ncbi:MAG: hypothetical protein HQL12_08740 [Candidatus Omnitrophica bacterium]|nr:hypothetical protein [Candidatus Omnitrophota bacterium]